MSARLDALRVGLSIGVGGGGGFALYLAWRITDLYTKAVEQLGSEKPPVRRWRVDGIAQWAVHVGPFRRFRDAEFHRRQL